jgi:hypothetical protein
MEASPIWGCINIFMQITTKKKKKRHFEPFLLEPFIITTTQNRAVLKNGFKQILSYFNLNGSKWSCFI